MNLFCIKLRETKKCEQCSIIKHYVSGPWQWTLVLLSSSASEYRESEPWSCCRLHGAVVHWNVLQTKLTCFQFLAAILLQVLLRSGQFSWSGVCLHHHSFSLQYKWVAQEQPNIWHGQPISSSIIFIIVKPLAKHYFQEYSMMPYTCRHKVESCHLWSCFIVCVGE